MTTMPIGSHTTQSIPSSLLLKHMKNVTTNAKGATAFVSTGNPILNLFTYSNKKVPTDLVGFTQLVKMIIEAKNYDSELFVKLLKFHRLIEKGSGIKSFYYVCMMVLKDEDPHVYSKILDWSYEYPKDILRLARISSMFSDAFSIENEFVEITGDIIYRNKRKSPGRSKKSIKKTKCLLSELNKGNLTTIKQHELYSLRISTELELFSQMLAQAIKMILLGKLYSKELNIMFFKYLGWETSHFWFESEIVWNRVESILQSDPIIEEIQKVKESEITSTDPISLSVPSE